jgi:uncharacterized phage protein (TIGR02218 family)
MAIADSFNVDNPQVVELYEFMYENGTYVRMTTHSRPVTFQSNAYTPAPISRDSAIQEAAVKVGTIRIIIRLSDEMRVLFDPDRIRNQRTMDRGIMKIYRVGLDDLVNNWTLRFDGITGLTEVTNTGIVAEFRDVFFMMLQNLPFEIYGESCNWIFGSTECGIDLDTVKVTGAADAGSSDSLLVDAARVEADGFFNRGRIEMTTGTLVGLQCSILEYTVGQFKLLPSFYAAIDNGDQYNAWPTCHKTWTGCNALANTDNNGSFPHVPKESQVK